MTVRHNFTSTITTALPHRLKIIIDGPTKTITWYIDNVLLSSLTPAAALDRMSTGVVIPQIMMGAFVPANGDVSVRGYAGSIPLLRYLVRKTT